MTDVSSRTLQVRLLILVFLAFIPAMGVFWYANRELSRLQLEAMEAELLRDAEVIATEYRGLLAESHTLLAALAEFPQIHTASFPACTDYLKRVVSHATHLTTISMIGEDGYLACGALTPGEPLFLGDRTYYVRATSRGQFAVGEFSRGRITGKPVVGMALPILEGDRARYVLAASMDLNALKREFTEKPLPPGFTFTVLDRSGQVMVRLPATGDFTLADSVGAMAGEDFPGMPEGAAAELASGTDLDGVGRLFAVAPLRSPAGGPEGYVALGRTEATLMADVDAIVDLQLRFLAIGGVLLLVLAWVLGHFWLVRRPAAS